ncbi:hypothetical protein KCU77_g13341, partial [Aureobasidium melanogenum]
MAPNNGPPLLLLFYNIVAAVKFGPRLYTSLQLRPSISLILHSITTASLFSAIAFFAIDTSLDVSCLLYKLLGFLLRRMLDYDLETSVVATQWQIPALVVERANWAKSLLGIVIGISASIYIKIKAGGWEAAKRNIAARHDAQTKPSAAKKDLGTAEQGGVPKEADHEPVFLWACWAFMYSSALFESTEWFGTLLGGKEVAESARGKWRMGCTLGAMVVAGAVGLARRRWLAKTKSLQVAEKEHVGEEGAIVSEKQ